MDRIKIGIVGCGSISSAHISALKKHQGFEIVGLCDINTKMAELRRKEYNLDVRVHSDYLRLLDEPDLDAIGICTPGYAHASISKAALESGKHVLCEKPMATSLDDAKQILEAARKSEAVFMLNHTLLFTSLVQKVVENLDSGLLGRIFTARLRSANFMEPDKNHPFYFDPTIGGVLLDLGYHPTYTLIRLLGMPKKVFARAKGLVFDGTIDNAVIFAEYEGAWGIIEVSFTSKGPYGGTRPVHVFGTKGTLIADFVPRPEIIIYTDGDRQSLQPKPSDHWLNMVDHFYRCITEKKAPISNAEEGYKAMLIIAKALESNMTGYTATLDN